MVSERKRKLNLTWTLVVGTCLSLARPPFAEPALLRSQPVGSAGLDAVFYPDLTSIRGWGCDQVRLPKGSMSLDTVVGSGTGLGLGSGPQMPARLWEGGVLSSPEC